MNVHTELGFWFGRLGWNRTGMPCAGSIPEFRLEATCGS